MGIAHQFVRGAPTPPADPDTLPVAEVRRSARETIRVQLRRKRGDLGCEMVVCETKGAGPARETQRHIRIPVGRLADTIAALRSAERTARRLGLLPGSSADPHDA